MKKIAIIYWSDTGNTESMAKNFDEFAFGCPSMGAEQLEESEFEPMFSSVEKMLSGKEIALFGSYGWGDGQWMRDWQERCTAAGAKIFDGEGLIIHEDPDETGKEMCRALEKELASS